MIEKFLFLFYMVNLGATQKTELLLIPNSFSLFPFDSVLGVGRLSSTVRPDSRNICFMFGHLGATMKISQLHLKLVNVG